MQGLAHYNDSPSPDATTHASSSKLASRARNDTSAAARATPQKRKASPSTSPRRLADSNSTTHLDVEQRARQDILMATDTEPSPMSGLGKVDDHFARPCTGPVGASESTSKIPHARMTDEELLARATRPASITGVHRWGIPDEIDPDVASPQLKAKVAHFLGLKANQNQHINTSLLASSTFHNPHIYSKLVDFVDLDERESFFPGHGWLTRSGIEDDIPQYGPKRMSEAQKRMQEETKARQEVGKRSAIAFQPGKSGRERAGETQKRGGGSGNAQNSEKPRVKDRESRSERERDRERDRYRPDRPRDVASSGKYSNTLGFGRRDREGGWDERDMTKEKPKYRYY